MESLVPTVIGTVIGVIAGVVTTFVVSRYYYVRAARALQEEVAKLRKLVNLVLRGLEESGLVEFTRKDGKIVGLVLKGTVEMRARATMSANADAINGNKVRQ